MPNAWQKPFSRKEFLGPVALRAYAAEFSGMFFFLWVTIGVVCSGYSALQKSYKITSGADIYDANDYAPSVSWVLTVALAFGMSIMVLVYSVAHISGGHLNPAVTMAMIVFGEINIFRGLIYIVVQTLGATVGVTMVDALWPESTTNSLNFGLNGINSELSIAQAFFMEFFGTALVVFVIFGTAVDPRGSEFAHHNAPLAIGFAVFLAHIVLIPMTGCGINPARSFASAAVSGVWTDQWLYWVAPLLGGSFGAAFNYFPFQFRNNPDNKHGIMAEGAQADPEEVMMKKSRSKVVMKSGTKEIGAEHLVPPMQTIVPPAERYLSVKAEGAPETPHHSVAIDGSADL
ncbi:hypothetical protein SARC_06186 [Sphaeroforma arctica JP610]|uniref:Aquaporin n=1 Tax=Sphaeroforma arctica JP610 TaxID=667725 RepID=A0A0L0FZU9_9EUKA|nr:hypothetical protein SARC_06186 [Sphaeroforma arctica JP610]KNC81498.1 hypothetical protein SARC_06186 [Sphaeroforma arctica JP610]|eukprot:XP_014155400.1 hypothetical protein SARC_06186 [Sphaeroforma arctica JP610]